MASPPPYAQAPFTLHGLVEAVARSHPEAPAVRAGGEALSYGELDGAAEIEAARVVASERLYFRKPGMPPGKIEEVTFAGVLRVRDAARLLETCRGGVGPAKSFGCGLLLLARV